MKEDVIEKALERLITAIISDSDTELSRIEMLEEAVSYAAIALGMSPPDAKALREQLDTVAVQVIADKILMEDLKIYQVILTEEKDEHIASVFATTDATMSNKIASLLGEQEKDNKKKPKKPVDYSIN